MVLLASEAVIKNTGLQQPAHLIPPPPHSAHTVQDTTHDILRINRNRNRSNKQRQRHSRYVSTQTSSTTQSSNSSETSTASSECHRATKYYGSSRTPNYRRKESCCRQHDKHCHCKDHHHMMPSMASCPPCSTTFYQPWNLTTTPMSTTLRQPHCPLHHVYHHPQCNLGSSPLYPYAGQRTISQMKLQQQRNDRQRVDCAAKWGFTANYYASQVEPSLRSLNQTLMRPIHTAYGLLYSLVAGCSEEEPNKDYRFLNQEYNYNPGRNENGRRFVNNQTTVCTCYPRPL